MEYSEVAIHTDYIHIAPDRQNCYHSEKVAYQIVFRAAQTAGKRLQIIWPRVVRLENLQLPEGIPVLLPSIAEQDHDLILMIPLDEHFQAGEEYLLRLDVQVNTYPIDQHLHAEAMLMDQSGSVLSEETSRIAVYGKSKALKYLPGIYDDDDFMSRFLMVFESFWNPISQQTGQIHNYFDPKLTPEPFVPWLASWIGVQMDDFLPIDRIRELIRHSLEISQKRGTPVALKTFLEIYSGGKATLNEQRASNFTLGPNNYLGIERALGTGNRALSIGIQLEVPQDELARTGFTASQYQKKIEEAVKSLVPANILFEVECEFISKS